MDKQVQVKHIQCKDMILMINKLKELYPELLKDCLWRFKGQQKLSNINWKYQYLSCICRKLEIYLMLVKRI